MSQTGLKCLGIHCILASKKKGGVSGKKKEDGKYREEKKGRERKNGNSGTGTTDCLFQIQDNTQKPMSK